jgi:hypothetical protein
MRNCWLLAIALAVGAQVQGARIQGAQLRAAPAADPFVQVDFSNPALSPPQWTLILHADGSGHFRSQEKKTPNASLKVIEAPSIDRDIQLSKEFAGHVFDAATHQKWFNVACESHLKVAFEGWKTLTYTGPAGQGSCTFNYSRNKEIQTLGESMQAVAETILEGARFEVLLQHDRLGLDQEMEYFTQAVEDGRAQEVYAIRDILERLAQDNAVLERVRKQARDLLAHAAT